MSGRPTIPELERRLIFGLLWPVVAMCRHFRVPLEVLERLCRLAYYEELRRGGQVTQAEVARIFGTSLRTVVGVERSYRSDFLQPHQEVERSRRLEEALAPGERSGEELAAELDEDIEDIQRALDSMVAGGRAVRHNGGESAPRFGLRERYQSLVRDDLHSRLAGLKHQLEVLLSAVHQRFFPSEAPPPSVARTLSFVAKPEDVDTLIAELIRSVRLQAIDVEERALQGTGGYERYGLTIALAATKDPDEGDPEARR